MGMKMIFLSFTFYTLLVLTGCQLTNNVSLPGQIFTTQSTDLSYLGNATEAAILEMPSSLQTKENPNLDIKQTFDLSQDLQLTMVGGAYQFAEGPVTSQDGNVYFSDVNAGKIYKWSPDRSVNIFVEGLNAPNGLAFDSAGNLVVCEGGNGRLISITSKGVVTVVADQYNGIRFNEPNDLWIDLQGGIYFTDPSYNSEVVQKGENVYYVTPNGGQVIRVVDDQVKPNGIEGSKDGKKLYIADWGANRTYVYDINSDGSLYNRQLVVASGSDGLTLDPAGNLYLTTLNQVSIYDASGKLLQKITTPENPTNLTFAGLNGSTLFITARTAVYTVQFSTIEEPSSNNSSQSPNPSGFSLTSPDIAKGGVLPSEYTCDGVSSTLALNWSGSPEGTKSYAVLMDHIASPSDIHWYWILYNIPVEVTNLAKNSNGVGILGTNSVNNKLEYAPPCSKGPGSKTYTYTVFALSAEPQFSVTADQINREAFLEALQGITLASAKLNVTYARP
jgi:gluconolactonase